MIEITAILENTIAVLTGNEENLKEALGGFARYGVPGIIDLKPLLTKYPKY